MVVVVVLLLVGIAMAAVAIGIVGKTNHLQFSLAYRSQNVFPKTGPKRVERQH